MARTITTAQRAAIAALRSGHFSRFRVTDSDGTWRDYTQYLKTDWFTGATVEKNIDSNTWSLNATLLRETGTLSLSPFRSDSLVNRNALGDYATALGLWRKWDLSVAVMREGYPPTATDWKEIAQGRIDVIEWSGEQINVTGRGEEAVLLDLWIATERQYGSVGGIAMETTLQSMSDNNLHALSPTIYTPVSPLFLMRPPWTQPKGNLFPAMVDVVSKAAFVLGYEYDASDVNRLTLFEPDRDALPGDEVWTLGPSEYTAITRAAVDKQGIRNFIKLRYAHATLGVQTVIYPHMAGIGTVACTAGAATFSNSQAGLLQNGAEIIVAGIPYTVSAFNGTTGATLLSQLATGGVPTFGASSFTAHGTLSGDGAVHPIGGELVRVDLEIDLSFESQVNDETKAQGMCDAIGSDEELPDLEQTIETRGAWFIQLYDFGKFEANGVHYDEAQYGGVSSLRYDIADATINTTIGTRARPAGAYRYWRGLARRTVPQLTFAEAIARITATTATTVTVTVTANPASPPQQVQLVGITGSATLNSGTAAGTWVTPNGTNNVWVFNRGAFQAGVGQVQFRAGNTSSFPNDDDFVSIEEQGRDTVHLATRARVISQTATTVVVRVAVADPYPQGAASVTITYSEQNTGAATSPASGQTVTPAATLTEAAGTYVDFTVTRPAFGTGAGRVTFTATAANRTTDSDAQDISEVGRDTVYLASRARVTATTPTTVTVRYAVADPYPQGADSATITYLELGLGAATSPASGGTVTPAATITEGASTYIDYTVTRPAFGVGAGRITFTTTAANRTSDSDAVDVPEADRDTVYLVSRARVTATTATTLTVRVAVADPYPQGADSATIGYTETGTGAATSPATGQTVTPAATLTEVAGSYIDYTITRPAFAAGSGRVTFTVTAANRTSDSDAVDVPAIEQHDTAQGSVAIDSNGAWEATIDGPANALSFRWSSSTSAFPADATVAASGTLVTGTGRFLSISGGPLTLGQTVYITIIPFSALSGGGIELPSIHIQGSYQTTSGSRTSRYAATAFFHPSGAFLFNRVNWAYFPEGKLTADGTGTPDEHFANVPVATGMTITAFRLRTYTGNAFDQVAMLVYRQDADGSSTQLGTTQTATNAGYSTLTVGSLTESASAGRSYLLRCQTKKDTGGGFNEVRMTWFEVDEDYPNLATGL